MLESMLEILQQIYIQIESEPHEFSVYPDIFPPTRYGVSDVASLLLLLVQ
jgi:hypothetical protein